MLRGRYGFFGFLAAMLPLFAAPAAADCRSELGDRELVWAWNEWVPYAYTGADGKPTGFDIDIVSRILTEAGCPFRFVNQPAKRAQQGLRDGSVDLLAAASVTPERQTFSNFSIPYRDERIMLFAKASGSDAYRDVTLPVALERRIHIAAGLGGWYGASYEQHQQALLEAGLLVLTSDLAGRLRMLAGDRVDLVIEDQAAGIATARQLGLGEKLVLLPQPMNSDPVSLMFGKKSVPQSVVALVDEAIKRLEKDGDYQLVIAKYTKLSN